MRRSGGGRREGLAPRRFAAEQAREEASPRRFRRGGGRGLGKLCLEIGDPRLGTLEGIVLHQRGLGQEIGGQRLLPHQSVDQLPCLAVDIAFRRRLQALEQAEDEIAFLRGHGGASCYRGSWMGEQEIVIIASPVKLRRSLRVAAEGGGR